jgi:hypothetical protein
MIPWYAPIDCTAWFRRLLSSRAVVLVLILVALVTTEFRFDWMERAAGAYLVTTNSYRPQSGTIWEQGHKADSARQTLAQYAVQRQNMQREAQQASSLGQVISSIAEEKGAMISSDHFLSLYLKLPPVLSNEIVSPYTLLTFTSTGKWERTFLEKQDHQLVIYLLDSQNQVIQRFNIGPELIEYIERGEVAVSSSLDQLSDFAAHIYPADRFFALLNALPEEVRKNIVAHPEELLRVSGRIRRVGISDGDFGDAVDLGFEVDTPDGTRVVLVQGARDEVRRLQHTLDESSSEGWPWSGGTKP